MNLSIILSLILGIAITAPNLHAQEKAQTQPPKPTLADLAWLTGKWTGPAASGETEELWMPPKDGLMLGLNRTTRQGRLPSFEYLRITATTNGITYYASPQGRAPTEFQLKELTPTKATFENLKHDFPQRIIYHLETPTTLHARIEGLLNGTQQAREWKWQKSTTAP